jgi:hypothetical protein
LKSISIPGISKIVTTESYLLKLVWTLLVLVIFSFGFHNISLSIIDYQNFDVITNIDRVTSSNVSFPAITFCFPLYSRNHYINGSVTKTEPITIKNDNIFRITNFIDLRSTRLYTTETFLNVTNYLDTFKTPTDIPLLSLAECIRFNGVTNKNLGVFTASSTGDYFEIGIKNFYKEEINSNEYYNYSFSSNQYFVIFIGDNFLNSFEKLEPILLELEKDHDIKIEKESIEVKLPEPYNPCQESSADKPYHQPNCIDSCIYREIKNKYNCTIPLSLFAARGSKQCDIGKSYEIFNKEFFPGCLKECPLDSCFFENFIPYITSTTSIYATSFKFSFRHLKSLNITQIPKIDSFTFVNNIGGGLGLFMGIAFPNLIELLQFLIEIFHVIFYQ